MRAPYAAAKKKKKDRPPSIGTQGGGQQVGPTDGGGAGAEIRNSLTKTRIATVRKYRVFFIDL